MLTDFGQIFIFILAAIALLGLMLTLSKILRPHRPNAEKLTTYESGEDPVNNANVAFNVRFYVVALIFVLFEVELVSFSVGYCFCPKRPHPTNQWPLGLVFAGRSAGFCRYFGRWFGLCLGQRLFRMDQTRSQNSFCIIESTLVALSGHQQKIRKIMYQIYGIPNCDTIKKTLDWFKANKLSFEFHDYKKEGISSQKLENWLDQVDQAILINRKGTTWRQLTDEQKASADTTAGAVALMQQQPSLIKRPLIEQDGKVLAVGTLITLPHH
jgi:arsenate reductase (glutaredoxin)